MQASKIKRITFRADESISAARATAHEQHTTLNAAFRLWLADYVGQQPTAREVNPDISAQR